MSTARQRLTDGSTERGGQQGESPSSTITTTRIEEFVQRAIPWAEQQVQALQEVRPDFDGYGAAAPTDEAVMAAIYFLANMKAICSTTEANINPVRDGGVSLEWEQGSKSFEIEIEPSGASVFLYKNPEANSRKFGPVFEDSNTTQAFLWALKLMFK